MMESESEREGEEEGKEEGDAFPYMLDLLPREMS